MKIRFLPVMIYFLVLILTIKLFDIIEGSKELSETIIVSKLSATSEKDPAPPADAEKKKAEEKPAEDKVEPAKEAKPEGEKKKPEEKGDLKVYTEKPKDIECETRKFSEIELSMLDNLAKRRDELNAREADIANKESILAAASQQIDNKMESIKQLKANVEKLLEAYNGKEDLKINSLVKIYENMKPKDAAKIFEGLDMDIILQVVDRMKEVKSAPILANMDPAKATILTQEFAKQRKLLPPSDPALTPEN